MPDRRIMMTKQWLRSAFWNFCHCEGCVKIRESAWEALISAWVAVPIIASWFIQ